MAAYPVAILGYGYQLGAPGRWLVHCADDTSQPTTWLGHLMTDWLPYWPDNAQAVCQRANDDLAEAAGIELRGRTGAELVQIDRSLPLHVDTWGSAEEPQLMLCALTVVTSGSMHAPFTPGGNTRTVDRQLNGALKTLGITPVQAVAQWHLVATTE